MYKRILVAVDGSNISHRALHEAVGLSKALQAKLRIVTVVEAAMISGKADYVDFSEVRKTVIRYGEEVQQKAKQLAQEGGVEAEISLIEIKRTGDRVTDMISKEADDWPADLIVIGTHGRRGFNSLLMGSVADGVMRIATKPVLLIRGN
ncbi:MAG: universal stress protein [Gammaproteobacteria bacterium]|nr:universal stress protein [Gammaproteobacteria bacterium]MDH5512762.1 universal stress protein [Gammaproteobacteria bacterium]